MAKSENLQTTSCSCRIDDLTGSSICGFEITVPKNLDSLDEFISYRVFSLGDFSEVETTRFSIVDLDDDPLLCLYSRGAYFPECGGSGCVGSGAPDPRFLPPISHTEKRPVIYLDSENGDCYFSTSTSSFEKSQNAAPALEFGYIYVDIEEDSTGNVFQLLPGIDIDSTVTAATTKYEIDINFSDNANVPTYRNNVAFSNNCAGTIEGGVLPNQNDLDCAIDAPVNKNDYFLHAFIVIKNTDTNPSLVIRERKINDARLNGVTIQDGETGGEASVKIENGVIIITIEDRVTTAQKIKEAIENDATISELVRVNLLGSKNEEVINDNGEQWPVKFKLIENIRNEQNYFSYFTYRMLVTNDDNELTSSESIPVFVSIRSKNDQPVGRNQVRGNLGEEETTIKFDLPIAFEQHDFLNEDLSYIITSLNSYTVDGEEIPIGEISKCANLSGSDGFSDLTCELNPVGNFNGEVIVGYQAFDQFGASTEDHTVTFNVENIDDPPVLCQYHRYDDAPECGLEGCISSFSPVGKITPSSHVDGAPVYYYQKGSAYCYRSTGTGANDWEIDETGHIADVIVNQRQEVLIDNIAVDEGGTGGEDEQTLIISDVAVEIESGDPTLLENQLVKFYNGTSFVEYSDPTTGLSFGDDDTSSAEEKEFKIKITPQVGDVGVARITFKIFDGVNIRTSSFRVTVQNVDVSHGGWENIQALGPKIGGSGYCEGIDGEVENHSRDNI